MTHPTSSGPAATGIPVPHLHLVWADLWPMLKPATLLAPDKPDVLARLLAGNAQLWAVYERRMPIAAIVTEITLVPEKRCRIWLVGGTRMREWVGDFLPKVEAWARPLGCVALWGSQSRPGWLRIVKKFGGVDIGGAWQRRIT